MLENRQQTVKDSDRKPSVGNRHKTVPENRQDSKPSENRPVSRSYTYRGGMFIKS